MPARPVVKAQKKAVKKQVKATPVRAAVKPKPARPTAAKLPVKTATRPPAKPARETPDAPSGGACSKLPPP